MYSISDARLKEIADRCNSAQTGPWKSYIEGRDHVAGSDFIMTKGGDDIELSGATKQDQDFIAHARQDVPDLLREIRRLKRLLDAPKQN